MRVYGEAACYSVLQEADPQANCRRQLDQIVGLPPAAAPRLRDPVASDDKPQAVTRIPLWSANAKRLFDFVTILITCP